MGSGPARSLRSEPTLEPRVEDRANQSSRLADVPRFQTYAGTGLRSLAAITGVDVIYGDTTNYLKRGEKVLVVDAGAGMLAYMASQSVGEDGRVLGVTHCANKLGLARSCLREFEGETSLHNVEFRQVRSTELTLDLEKYLAKMRVLMEQGKAAEMADLKRAMRKTEPPVPFDTFDAVITNSWLKFKDEEEKTKYFQGVFEALKKGGRAVLSTVVSDECVTEELKQTEELVCEGDLNFLTEEGLFETLERAGFYGIRLLWRDADPWKIIQHIEFRRCTVEAFKGKQGPCKERFQALLYKGPFKEVLDDDHHRFHRGKRYAVCDKTYNLYLKSPYAQDFIPLPPNEEIPIESAKLFACNVSQLRDPKVTKGFEIDRQDLPSDLTSLG